MAVLKHHLEQAKAFKKQQEAERIATAERQRLASSSEAVPVKVRTKKGEQVSVLLIDVNFGGKLVSLGIEGADMLKRMVRIGSYCQGVHTRRIGLEELWNDSPPAQPIVESQAPTVVAAEPAAAPTRAVGDTRKPKKKKRKFNKQ